MSCTNVDGSDVQKDVWFITAAYFQRVKEGGVGVLHK
jgi:hypothetical protein